MYRKLGGPGTVSLPDHANKVFLVYDDVHIFKNLRNNWITEPKQELHFREEGKDYVARWRDVKALHDEDRKTSVRLTKLTFTSVYPKTLQRQSVPLVCQVFHDKTVAAFLTMKKKCRPRRRNSAFYKSRKLVV